MSPRVARVLSLVALALAIALVPTALAAGKPDRGPARGGCAANAPRVSIDNTYAWASRGSWGLPGQELRYAINVFNADVGCGSSSFVLNMTAPSGFAISMPATTITLGSNSSGYLWAYVTSPSGASDGDYPLTATIERSGSPGESSSSTSYYKVYSTDTAAPKLYWMNPADGGTLSGRSAYLGFASSDDHSVKQVELSLDGALVATTVCDNISYECQVSYKVSLRRLRGQHQATFTFTDWLGNVATKTSTFTVG
jgi:hypothetical protein